MGDGTDSNGDPSVAVRLDPRSSEADDCVPTGTDLDALGTTSPASPAGVVVMGDRVSGPILADDAGLDSDAGATGAALGEEPLLKAVGMRSGTDSTVADATAVGVGRASSVFAAVILEVVPMEAVTDGVATLNAGGVTDDDVMGVAISGGVTDRDVDAEFGTSAVPRADEADALGVLCANGTRSSTPAGTKLVSKDSNEAAKKSAGVSLAVLEGGGVNPSTADVDGSASTAVVDAGASVPFVTIRLTCLGK